MYLLREKNAVSYNWQMPLIMRCKLISEMLKYEQKIILDWMIQWKECHFFSYKEKIYTEVIHKYDSPK